MTPFWQLMTSIAVFALLLIGLGLALGKRGSVADYEDETHGRGTHKYECAECGGQIEVDDVTWHDGEPFCSQTCIRQFNEEEG